MTETDPRRRLSRKNLIAAGLMGGALGATILGRLLACPGCDYELAGVPLFAVGSAYYLVLALLALFGAAPRIIGWAALPGVAFQAGLARFLITLGSPCPTCLISAACLFLTAGVCFWRDFRWTATTFNVLVVGIVSLPLWSMRLVETERVEGLPTFARASDFRPAPESATLLVAYVREGCPYCLAFERDYEPKLSLQFGPDLVIRKIDSKDRGKIGRLPTFVIRNPEGRFLLVRGLPRYPDLVDSIRGPRR